MFGGKDISPVAPARRHVVARAGPVLDQPLAAHLSEIAAAPVLRSTHHERHDRGNCHGGEADHNEGVHESIRRRGTFVVDEQCERDSKDSITEGFVQRPPFNLCRPCRITHARKRTRTTTLIPKVIWFSLSGQRCPRREIGTLLFQRAPKKCRIPMAELPEHSGSPPLGPCEFLVSSETNVRSTRRFRTTRRWAVARSPTLHRGQSRPFPTCWRGAAPCR